MEAAPSTTTGLFFSGTVPQKVESDLQESSKKVLSTEDRHLHFDIDDTVKWITSNGYTRIALQFPDALLGEAVPVSKDIETATGAHTFILADTSYRSCCVDEVAAAHASCDALVHYGDACLSAPTQNIPVRYVYGYNSFDVSSCSTALESVVLPPETMVVILTDTQYSKCIPELCTLAIAALKRPVYSCLPVHEFDCPGGSEFLKTSLGRVLPYGFADVKDVCVIFVGDEDSALLPLWLLSHPQCTRIVHINEHGQAKDEQASTWRGLRKRLFLVEKLKDAHTIGLVIGTVAVAGHREAVQRIRELARAKGKKVYTISVGKVNVAKLANFSADIDVFVLLSCPLGVLLDGSSFDKPILSLFEAEVALNPAKQWMAGTGWTADFNRFLTDPIGASNPDEDPDVSLVSGRVRAAPPAKATGQEDEQNTVALYTSGDYFKERSWRGLNDSTVVDGSLTVEPGRRGRAAGYANEPEQME